jgi:hypothetical protein
MHLQLVPAAGAFTHHDSIVEVAGRLSVDGDNVL